MRATPPRDDTNRTAERLEVARISPSRLHQVVADERVRRRLAVVLVAALLGSSGACVALWSDRDQMTANSAISEASLRDEAHRQGMKAIQTMLSADHRSPQETLDRWSDVTTGRLGSRLMIERDATLKQLRDSKEVTTAKVVESGLVSWDEAGGTARLLTVVEITTQGTKKKRTAIARYLAMTQRSEGAWKLAAVQSVGDAS